MIGWSRPGGRVTFLWRRERRKEAPLPQRRLSRCPRSARPAGRVETRPGGLRHRRDNSRRPRAALGAAEGEGVAGSASPLPAGCRAFVAGMAVGNDSSPRRRPGSRAFDLCRLVLRCFRLAVIGRVSPRRASDFLVATRKSPKSAPCRSAGLRRCPRSTRVRRVASKLALAGSDIDATIPAGRGLHRRCRRESVAGSASPLPAGCGAFVWARHPGTIRRPGAGRGPVL